MVFCVPLLKRVDDACNIQYHSQLAAFCRIKMTITELPLLNSGNKTYI